MLGEPGSGKSDLLQFAAEEPGSTRLSAKHLTYRTEPLSAVELVLVDGLDELSVRGEGDAVSFVLSRLRQLGCASLVLACRAADWDGASAEEELRTAYRVDATIAELQPNLATSFPMLAPPNICPVHRSNLIHPKTLLRTADGPRARERLVRRADGPSTCDSSRP